MSDFDKLIREINDGMTGKNMGLSMGHSRLNRYIGIRKRIYTLVFGATGSGKSAFTHDSFILNPYEHFKEQIEGSGVDFKVILFSMERSRIYILAKWLSRKIFLNTGIEIPIPKMMGWWKNKLTTSEYELILEYKPYITDLLKYVDIVEGAQNPTGIYKYVREYAEKTGKIEQFGEFNKIYVPNNPNQIVIPIVDHFGLTKPEKGQNKKEAIDKVSEYFQWFRDFLGYSPVGVSQMNRDLSNPIYQKIDSFEPTIDQTKESGRPAEDSDCVISLFDPIRYKTNDINYDVESFINPDTGAKCFRSIKVLKNTYGEDDVRVGMAFHGSGGIFKELPRPKEMEGFDFSSIFDGSYFFKK